MNFTRFAFVSLLSVSLGVALSASASAQDQHSGTAQHDEHSTVKHSFGVAQFDAFHERLHRLQHEALPNNDFQTIRAEAAELNNVGLPIIKLGVPTGVSDAATYKAVLKKFRAALKQYQLDAKAGTDEQLRTSYSAVHDTFEELAGMLPRKAQH